MNFTVENGSAVAVERNNTINEFGDEFDARFDAALRRHLKGVNATATVQTCADFNPEQANAYVENALGTMARARYETHLSVCTSCRLHVVEIFRLMPPEERAVSVIPEITELAEQQRTSWLAGVARWFDFSAWKWNTAALAGAGAVVLLALAIPIVWRQTLTTGRIDTASAKPPSLADVKDEKPDSTTAASPSNVPAGVSAPPASQMEPSAKVKESQSRPKGSVPVPSITPAGVNPPVALPGNGRAPSTGPQQESNIIAVKVSDPSGALVPNARLILRDAATGQARSTATTDSTGQSNFTNLAQGRYVVEAQANGFTQTSNVALDGNSNAIRQVTVTLEQRQVAESAEARADTTTVEKSARVASNQIASGGAPARAAEKEARDQKSKTARVADKTESDQVAKKTNPAGLIVPKPALPPGSSALKPSDKPEAKTEAAPSGNSLTPRLRPLTLKAGNKTFVFENGVWRDTGYDPGSKWPVIRLTRGSDEYEQTLTDIPSLRQFFNLKGKVVVLWQGTVYEVVGK